MCQALARSGHDVTLVNLGKVEANFDLAKTRRFYNVESVFDLECIPLARYRGRLSYIGATFFGMFRVQRWVRQFKPDLVLSRYLPGGFAAATVGARLVYESHFPVWHSPLERGLFFLLGRLKPFCRLVVITEELRRVYLRRYTWLKSKSVVVASDAADPVEEIKRVRPWRNRNNALQVGYSGNLYPGKGIELILRLAPLMPEIDFHIVGGTDKEVDIWRSRFAGHNVSFHGFVLQERLGDYLAHFDVCLLPVQRMMFGHGFDRATRSKNLADYTSPMKLFEYMAYGKPIIASDLPVLREVLNNEFSLLVEPDDTTGWIDAINYMKHRDRRQKMGIRAKEIQCRSYCWQKRCSAILDNLIASPDS